MAVSSTVRHSKLNSLISQYAPPRVRLSAPLLVAPGTGASAPSLVRVHAAARGRPRHNLGAEADRTCTLCATATAIRSAAGRTAVGVLPAVMYTGLHARARVPAPALRHDADLSMPALRLREDARQATHEADTVAAVLEATPFDPAVHEPARCRALVRDLGLIQALPAILGVGVALTLSARAEGVVAAMTFEIADLDPPRHNLLLWTNSYRGNLSSISPSVFQCVPFV